MELSKKDKAYFKKAFEASQQSDHRCKIGCVVVNNHRILSSGHNSASERHGFQVQLDKKFFHMESAGCKHAEIDALLPLIRARIDLTKAVVYTYRKNKLDQIAMSRPCPRCMSVIKSCGIRKIKYTTPDGYATEILKNF